MKYFIITILTLTAINSSHAATCGRETVNDINKCNVDDLITQFVDYETCNFQESLPNTFTNLICDPVVPLSFFEGKLQEWKDDAIAIIVEQERVDDIQARLEALGIVFGPYGSVTGLRDFMVECNYSHPNSAVWVKEVFDINNPTFITCLESQKIKVDKDKSDEKIKDNAKKKFEDDKKTYDCTGETGYSLFLCEGNKQ